MVVHFQVVQSQAIWWFHCIVHSTCLKETLGPKAVLFLHGFPEIWYSRRHQMVAAAAAGYRAIAFDFRGYGLSQHPPELEKASFFDLVADVIGVMDSLGISKAFLLGKDFGEAPAFLVVGLHPERVSGVIRLGIPFMPPGVSVSPFHLLPKGFYLFRCQEAGQAEADFGRFDVKTVIRNIYMLFCGSELQVASADDQEILDLADPSAPLPRILGFGPHNIFHIGLCLKITD